MVSAAIFVVPVAKSLAAGGFSDPSAESSRAAQLLEDKFHQPGMQLVIMIVAPDGARGPAARAAGLEIVRYLTASRDVTGVTSPWTAPPRAAADLISIDGKSAMIVAGIAGGEKEAPARAKLIADTVLRNVAPEHRDLTILAGGSAMLFAQIISQTERDVLVMESIALPISFIVLVWVFGGLLAAALPLAVGGLAIVGSLSVLRLIAMCTDVSIFALNLSTALGLALAIDYTLLIISRYRDEVAAGADSHRALRTTMVTAGRTVVFSATTVALSLVAMVLFPMYFLKSFAYAGIATVTLCALASLAVTPAAIVLLGPRLDALDVRRGLGRLLRRSATRPGHPQELFWYRWTKSVIRRAVLTGLAGSAVLLALGLPFLGVKWGFPDDRVLPASASARQVGDRIRDDFACNAESAVIVVVPDATGVTPAEFNRYAAQLSRVSGVQAVSSPTGTFPRGTQVAPPTGAAGLSDGSAFITVSSDALLFSSASEAHCCRFSAPSARARRRPPTRLRWERHFS